MASRERTPAGSTLSYDLRSGARALCSRAVDDVGMADTTDGEEDRILNDSYCNLYDDGGGGDDDDSNYDDNRYKVF